MKVCAAEGCNIEFEPQTANHKFADKLCRKSIDINGLCKYRRDNGPFEIGENPLTGTVPETESELRLSYNKLLQEYNKAKEKNVDLADAVYRAVREDIESVKYVPVPKPKFGKATKGEEVAVAVIADWQLAKITPDYNSQVCEERIYKYAEKIIQLTEIQRQDHPVKELHIWALGDIIEGELIFPGQSFLVFVFLFLLFTVVGKLIMKYFFNLILDNFFYIVFVVVI